MLHPAGTSKESDKCDLSKNSEIAPLTLRSMDKSFFTTYFVSHRKTYLSKRFVENIYTEKCNKIWRSDLCWDTYGSNKDDPDIYGFLSHWPQCYKMPSHVGDNIGNWWKNINYQDHPYWIHKCLNVSRISIPYYIFSIYIFSTNLYSNRLDVWKTKFLIDHHLKH